jgi:fibronectin type III domain protein
MARIKLNIRDLSVPDKVARGRQIVSAMTNNTNFSTPHPSLSDVTASLATLEQTHTSLQTAKATVKAKATALTDAEAKAERILSQLAAYVESIAGSDETIITSAGLETKMSRSAPTVLSPPQGLSTAVGDHDKKIDLSWKKVAKAKSYTIQFSPDPPTAETWVHAAITTASSATIENLTSGTRYWFRVAAVGAMGQSGWSEPATRIAP